MECQCACKKEVIEYIKKRLDWLGSWNYDWTKIHLNTLKDIIATPCACDCEKRNCR